MSSELSCEQFREIAPELALGVATGDERADALRHAARCTRCRAHLDELSDVADGLLLLVPEHEPPVGFETRVLERFGPPRRVPWIRRHAALIAAALVAGIVVAGTVVVATEEDRDLANSYRQTLAVANGEYFGAVPLLAADGTRAGLVYVYQGDPSWAFVFIESGADEDRYEVELVTTDGRTLSAGSFRPSGDGGSWGHTTPVDVHVVASIHLVEGGRVAFWARIH